MALEDYDLGALRTRLADEFGIDTSVAANATILDNKINDAQKRIVSFRPNWAWLNTSLVIDIAAPVSVTCTLTQGSRVFGSFSGGTPTARQIVTTQTSGSRPSEAYLTTSAVGTDATMERQYLGTTAAGSAVRIAAGFFQLPSNFIRTIGKPYLGNNLADPELAYRAPTAFDKLQRQQLAGTSLNNFYTVVNDPLGLEDNKYLAIYPFIAELQTLHVRYYQDVNLLSSDTDVPLISREARLVLLDMAAWFVAAWQKHDSQEGYSARANQGLQELAQEHSYVDDEGMGMDAGIAGLNFIPPPANYPLME